MDERLRRRRFLLTAGAMASVVAAAWGLYQYIASAPLRAQSAFLEGMRLKGAGSYDEATRRFTEAVYIWPQMTEGYLQRGLARQSMNQVDAAIEDFEHVIKQDPGNGAAHRALGVIYRERGELNRAVSEFTVSTSLTGDADAFYQRGQVRELLGQHQQAILDYNEAINVQPEAPYVYRARAMSRDALGDRGGAEADRRTASEIERRR